jgi:hypothetical protein
MADLLVKAGTIGPPKWTETLGSEIRAAMRDGRPDNMDTYCQAVLSALERLLDAGGNISHLDLAQRRDEWMRAYLHTPHGDPVELDNGRRR